MSWHNAHLHIHGFIGPGCHQAIIPPSVVAAPIPHISASSLIGLTLKAKFSKTERGPLNACLVGRNNDAGYFVPHISIPPTNVLLPVTIGLGGSKVLFGSSKVHINVGGSATHCGCCLPPIVPFGFNMACNFPCNFLTDFVIAPNTVEVGMTLGDILMGIVSAYIDMVVSLAFGWGAGKVGGAVVNAIARRVAQRSFTSLASTLGPDVARRCVNDMVENLAERVTSQIANTLVSEAAKVTYELAIDSAMTAGAGRPVGRGDAYDAVGTGAAGLTGSGPANDPRIYSTDGPGVRTGGW